MAVVFTTDEMVTCVAGHRRVIDALPASAGRYLS
jgi:hypothetical protein